ncbi:Oidioi.mRNA.OKI2018_I69.chr1.g3073.t1.cds [Oikopleura dioica]|uniref:Oidioi.mRNA.OKI2018_I69.chr1.g3073.t1.cds n=1 Tax=Oikopleura dioica TaxID=34765 RepID=A0ABN7T286_OIKDI|nr:Oidioi.mRNA.OKI2018_I69.chr1.g3073.t1.cds [Oikopleura dioica]
MSFFTDSFSLYRKNVKLADEKDKANASFEIDGGNLFLASNEELDWDFYSRIEELHTLGAVAFHLANSLVFDIGSTSKPRLSTQYVDASAWGELVTVSSVVEGNGRKYGVLGIDLTFLTPMTKLNNPLFENIFGGAFKSEVFFLDQLGQVIYHPRIGGPEFPRTWNREKVSYKEIHSKFYSDLYETEFIDDIEEILLNFENKPEKTVRRKESYEIHVLLDKSPGLIMIVQFLNDEKEEIRNLTADIEDGFIGVETVKKPTDCTIFLGYAVCYENVDFPIILLDAVNETIRFGSNPDFSQNRNSADSGNFNILSGGKDAYNKNLKTPSFAIEDSRELLLQPTRLTKNAKRDLSIFKDLPSIMKTKFGNYSEKENILRIFASTATGLFYSYPHWNINPDYYAGGEDWVKNATLDSVFTEELFNRSVRRMSRAFSGKDSKGVRIVIGIDVVLSIENIYKLSESEYASTTYLNSTQQLCLGQTCDCLNYQNLELPPFITKCGKIQDQNECEKNIFCDFAGKCQIKKRFVKNRDFFNSRCETSSYGTWMAGLIPLAISILLICSASFLITRHHKNERIKMKQMKDLPIPEKQPFTERISKLFQIK